MDWEKFAFSGLPVIQFVMKGDSIIAITACTDEKAFVLSTDGGKTCKAITPPEFLIEENELKVIPYSISQNSQNANSLLALVEPIGVVKSVNFEKVGRLSVLFMAAIRIGLLDFILKTLQILQYRGNYDI